MLATTIYDDNIQLLLKFVDSGSAESSESYYFPGGHLFVAKLIFRTSHALFALSFRSSQAQFEVERSAPVIVLRALPSAVLYLLRFLAGSETTPVVKVADSSG